MSAEQAKQEQEQQGREKQQQIKQLLKRLRAERPDQLKEARARNKAILVPRRAMKKALGAGPLTVPQLAEAANLSTDQVLWQIAAMRYYGLVAEDEQDGDYFKYRLVPAKKEGR